MTFQTQLLIVAFVVGAFTAFMLDRIIGAATSRPATQKIERVFWNRPDPMLSPNPGPLMRGMKRCSPGSEICFLL